MHAPEGENLSVAHESPVCYGAEFEDAKRHIERPAWCARRTVHARAGQYTLLRQLDELGRLARVDTVATLHHELRPDRG